MIKIMVVENVPSRGVRKLPLRTLSGCFLKIRVFETHLGHDKNYILRRHALEKRSEAPRHSLGNSPLRSIGMLRSTDSVTPLPAVAQYPWGFRLAT